VSDTLSHKLLHSGLSGVAGEYFVAGELSRRGFIASVTLGNAQGFDILATKPDGTNIVGLQVKTNQHSLRKWPVSYKVESSARSDLYFVFVNLNGINQPSYHIVLSAVVAEHCRTNHATWLATLGKGGRPHKDNPIRTFTDSDGLYLGKWEILDSLGA